MHFQFYPPPPGWTTSGVSTDGWTCTVTLAEPARISMYSLSCGDGTESCVTTCGNGVIDEYEECDVATSSAMCVNCVVQAGYTCTEPATGPSVCSLDTPNACLATALPNTMRKCVTCSSSSPELCGQCGAGFLPHGPGCLTVAASSFGIDVTLGTPNITLLPSVTGSLSLALDVPVGLGTAISDLEFAVEAHPASYNVEGYTAAAPVLQFSVSPYLAGSAVGSTSLSSALVFTTVIPDGTISAGYTPSLLLVSGSKPIAAKTTCNLPYEEVRNNVLVTHVCHLSTFAVAGVIPDEVEQQEESSAAVPIDVEADDDSSSTIVFVLIGFVVIGGAAAGAFVALRQSDLSSSKV